MAAPAAAAEKIERKINKLVSGGGERKSDTEMFNGGNCMAGERRPCPIQLIWTYDTKRHMPFNFVLRNKPFIAFDILRARAVGTNETCARQQIEMLAA